VSIVIDVEDFAVLKEPLSDRHWLRLVVSAYFRLLQLPEVAEIYGSLLVRMTSNTCMMHPSMHATFNTDRMQLHAGP
jgi:hypothetical protein